MNDRPEFLLEKDRQTDQIRENYWNNFADSHNLPDSLEGSPENGIQITSIVRDLISRGGGRHFSFSEQIYWDAEDLWDAVDQVLLELIVPEGWDEPIGSESIDISDESPQSNQFDIVIRLWKPSRR